MVGHPNLLDYVAIAENESKARVRFEMMRVRGLSGDGGLALRPLCSCPFRLVSSRLASSCLRPAPPSVQKMLQPCGPPPEKNKDF